MASTSNLRHPDPTPPGPRTSSVRARIVLALAAILLAAAAAFLAVSELATLHGAKAAVRMPAFLTHVREPAPGNRKLAGATA